MCIILDNNTWGDFIKNKEDMKPIRKWLEQKNGKLVYSNHIRFQELSNNSRRYLAEYYRQGKAHLIPHEKVEKEIEKINIQNDQLKSNDLHILGLAKASNTTVLCTKDRSLHTDFKQIIQNGKIYKNKSHTHLLTKDLCQ